MSKVRYFKKKISEKEAEKIAKSIIGLKEEFKEIDREINKAIEIKVFR